MNQIILTVDCKKTSHIYTTYDSEIVLAIDKLLFNMSGAGVYYKRKMIEVKAKSIGKNKYNIMVNINGTDETIIAEVMALHKQLLKTPRGANILTDAMDQMQEYLKEVNHG